MGGQSNLGQWGRPKGLKGWLIARFMAGRAPLFTQAALDLLAPGRADTLLEIGFGSGAGIGLALDKLPEGRAVGIDHAPLMVTQASARLSDQIAAGRVHLIEAGVEHIPCEDRSFDGAYTVNCFHFWQQPEVALNEVRRVLKPGAPLVVAQRIGKQTWRGVTEREKGEKRTAKAARCLSDAGFLSVSMSERPAGKLAVGLVKGMAPSS